MTKYLVDADTLSDVSGKLAELAIQMIDMGYDEYDAQIEELTVRLDNAPEVDDDAVIVPRSLMESLYKTVKARMSYLERFGFLSEDGCGETLDDLELSDLNKQANELYMLFNPVPGR